MAIELGAAYISILPSTDKLAPAIKAELADIQDDADRTGKESGRKFGDGFKGAIGTALKGGLLAGVAGIGALGAVGIKTAADMEQAQIAFTTMLGSGVKAKGFIADLSAFAAKTPFDFPGLQDAASSLISAGINAKDVIPIMTSLGNATSGMGTGAEGVQRATIALQQMNAAGKITGEDLNQLRDAGIPVFDLLAAATGKTKKEVAALAASGKLGATELAQLMDALKDGRGLERFNGLMEKQSQSLTGMWSTFSDTLNMGMAKAVTPLIPLLKEGLAGAAKALPPILEAFATSLKNVIEFSIAAVKWGKEHKTLLTILGTVVASVTAGILAYKIVVGTITAVTRAWAIAQGILNVAMSLNPIGLVIAAIVALGVALYLAWQKSETFRNIVTGAFDMVKAAGGKIADFFTKTLPDAFGKAIGWVKANWPKILAILTGPIGLAVLAIAKNWDQIKGGAAAAKDWIVDKFNALVGFVKGLPGRIGSAASGMFDSIKASFKSAINWIIGKWNDLSFSIGGGSIMGKDIPKATLSTPDIPYLADGGILTRATLNVAGEAGPEAVLPLDRLDQMLVSARMDGAEAADRDAPAERGGDTFVVNGDTNPEVTAARVARRINNRKV